MKIKRLISLILLFGFVFSMGVASTAATPYANYYLLESDFALPIPAAYECIKVIDFKTKEEGRLSAPEDLFIDENDRIYVADTKNNRIVVLNADHTFAFEISGSGTYEEGDMAALKEPRGVYVDSDGTILVADSGNARLVEFTKYGNFRYSYSTPDSEILSDDFTYSPHKVAKDSRGYIYVASTGEYKGIIMLGSDGVFRQYYGANKVNLSLWDSIARVLFSREDRLGKIVNLPYTFNNIYAGNDGYVYATTTGLNASQVRKINSAGSDAQYAGYDFTDQSLMLYNTVKQNFTDVAVDKYNNMYVLDQTYGRIYEYDEWGQNLFVFGTNGLGYGQFSTPTSIAVDSQGRLYVLNQGAGTISVFAATEFASLVHEANYLYSEGQYDASKPLWQEILNKNNYYTLALRSMGEIEMRKENYDAASDYFYTAEDPTLVSEAFNEIRTLFLKNNFSIIASVVVVVLVAWVVFLSIKRNRRRKYGVPPEKHNFMTPVKHFFKKTKQVAFHPIDGFEGIRYEGQGFYRDAFGIMLLYVIVSIASAYLTSFVYRGGTPLSMIDPLQIIYMCLLPWIVVCVVNYGVTTIMYGEGRFRDVIIGGAYCHVPLMYLLLPFALLTHLLTLNEASLFNLAQVIIYIWVVLLVYFCIKGVHGFHPVKAFVVFFLTLVGVVAVALLFMIVYGLAEQMFDFIIQFGKELSYLV